MTSPSIFMGLGLAGMLVAGWHIRRVAYRLGYVASSHELNGGPIVGPKRWIFMIGGASFNLGALFLFLYTNSLLAHAVIPVLLGALLWPLYIHRLKPLVALGVSRTTMAGIAMSVLLAFSLFAWGMHLFVERFYNARHHRAQMAHCDVVAGKATCSLKVSQAGSA